MEGSTLSLLLLVLTVLPVDDEVKGPSSLLVVSPLRRVDVTPRREVSKLGPAFDDGDVDDVDDDNSGPELAFVSVSIECGSLR
jgi:hypothetical protein